jgi:hypothetical protein
MSSLGKLANEMKKKSQAKGFREFARDGDKYTRSGANLVFYTLKDFLGLYHDGITDYQDVEPYLLKESDKLKYEILCLVDISESKEHTMSKEMRKKYRKAGKLRRLKLDEKFHYVNPLNRIHSYLIIERAPGDPKFSYQTIAINVICSSNYSDIKGVGSFMMKTLVSYSKEVGFENIVLEVGNYDAEEHPDLLSSEEEEEEDDYDSYSDEEEDEEDTNYEDLIDCVSDGLWKKSVRHHNSVPYYSFSEEYIHAIISEYLYNETPPWDEPTIIQDEEYGYGGYFYNKGKNNSKQLMTYYHKLGFVEEPKIHTEWKCFSSIPLPAMLLKL